ncbi:transposase [Methylobacterium oryzae]|uniref:RNA-guided endonuclease InsQ/TnpB family protein n=1 Tax=Methylobacterium oryzae TaxID=334852 RepID=UPI002F35D93D
MLRVQAYRFELRPDGAQERLMSRSCVCRRYVFNRALALRKARHAAGDKHLSYADLCKILTGWKAEAATVWLKEVHSQVLQQALKDLDRAYRNFFEGRGKFPRFKKKGQDEAFRHPQGVRLDQPNGRIYLPKLGWMRYRASRFVAGEIGQVTVSRHAGRWFVSVQTEREVEQPVHPATTLVGIDVGVVRFATLSDGTVIEPANAFRSAEAALAKAQRAMSRKVKFSANWKKAKAKVQQIQARIARIRSDFLHKASTTISKNHAVVCVEDLNMQAMTASAAGTVEAPGSQVRQKAGLNKAILDQGWGEFRRQLGYKQDWRGGWLLAVPAPYTSQTCPECGHVAAENRPSQAVFRCVACGYEANADDVGSINIARAGHARLACGHTSPVGASAQEPAEVRQALAA